MHHDHADSVGAFDQYGNPLRPRTRKLRNTSRQIIVAALITAPLLWGAWQATQQPVFAAEHEAATPTSLTTRLATSAAAIASNLREAVGAFLLSMLPPREVHAGLAAQAAAAFEVIEPTDHQPVNNVIDPLANTPLPQPVHTHTIETVVYREPVEPVERTVLPEGVVTQTALAEALVALRLELFALLTKPAAAPPIFTGAAPVTSTNFQAFALAQRIDQLSGTTLTNITVNGVSGLTAADIPVDIIAGNYLPLSGGSLTGDLHVDGNVGIGRDNPLSRLHIQGNIESGVNAQSNLMTLVNTNPNSGSYAGILFQSAEIGGDQRRAMIVGGQDVAGGAAGYLGFHTRGNGMAEKMRIEHDGNVGIGTASPSALLTVGSSGSFQVDSAGRISTGGAQVGNHPLSLNIAGNGFGIALGDRSVSGTMYVGRTSGAGLGGNSAWIGFGGDGTVSNNWIDLSGYGSTPHIRITNTGNVGIGTTTPWGKLSITGAGTGTGKALVVADSANAPRLVVQDNGNVGIGTTTPSVGLHVDDKTIRVDKPYYASGLAIHHAGTTSLGRPAIRIEQAAGSAGHSGAFISRGMSSGNAFLSFGTTGAAPGEATPEWGAGLINNPGVGPAYKFAIVENTTAAYSFGASGNGQTLGYRLVINPGGYIGIGTTNPTAQLHTTGTVRFSNFGAGTLETDASGNVTTGSDEALKTGITPFGRSLSELLQINPIIFFWDADSGMDTTRSYAGFSAQNVRAVIPEAVGTNPAGLLTLSDRPILAAAINAIKELHAKLTDLATTVAGFADRFASDQVTTTKLCVEDVCVTRAQFLQMVQQSTQQTSAVSPPSATPTEPEEPEDNTNSEDLAAAADNTIDQLPEIPNSPSIVPEDESDTKINPTE